MRVLRRELRAVDDVAAVARQLLAALLLGGRGARLGELAGDAPHLHHLRVAAEGQDQRHLQEQLEIVADVVGLVLLEALRAVSALQQEALALRHVGQLLLEVAHLLDEHQRGIVAQIALHLFQRRLVRVLRHLEDRLAPPAVQLPRLSHGTLLRSQLLAFTLDHADRRARIGRSHRRRMSVGLLPAYRGKPRASPDCRAQITRGVIAIRSERAC